jgi:hypothetical protein
MGVRINVTGEKTMTRKPSIYVDRHPQFGYEAMFWDSEEQRFRRFPGSNRAEALRKAAEAAGYSGRPTAHGVAQNARTVSRG